jgi:hypothetical protein
MAGDVVGDEVKELAKHRIMALSGLNARQDDLTAWAYGVVDPVTLAQL